MPPSPAMRCSPGREPRGDSHKRGRSLESGIPLKQRDDDLALFNEVQSREQDNFLLQANDDFEDVFTNKLRHFSDFKLGINIPARGESSDLLNTEEEKNDYEWLITPPDTPLFPSLDDETPQINLVQRGRPRTQPISISRSSTMEKSHRSSRGSASPNRVSISPRSHYNNTLEGRNRASLTPSPSPPTTLRPTSASLRSSPPSRKPSSPVPRRLSTGSNGSTSTRGISPVKTTRGNSASPKVKAWQSNIPGFSTEVPPNLRTSLADRPASYVRGSSPASRSSRQSMSPTASRSIGSSHSHEDDMESFSSVVGGSAHRSSSRRGGGFQSNRGLVSKKPSRTVSSSSAPKRSFDLALRQMDHRKGPQNMFRPLLSSVPSSTFYAGIANSPHHTRNSSVTTSSNGSSGLGLSGTHDHESNQDDATSGYVKVQQDYDVDDEVFVIEKDDSVVDGTRNDTREALLNESRNLDPTSLIAFDSIAYIDSQKCLLICSNCGCEYTPIENKENNKNLCADCVELYSPLTIIDQAEATTKTEPHIVVVESPEVVTGNVKPQSGQQVDLVKESQTTYGEPIWNFLPGSSLSRLKSEERDLKQVSIDMVDFSNSKVESLEGATGISILLKRSSSIKGAILRNTNFSASSISYDDLSYVRDSTNSMRSVSASSSVDFGHMKQTMDSRFQRQLSSTKSETENYKYEVNTKHHRSGSSVSGTSSHAFHPSSLGTSTYDSSGRDVVENHIEENENENNVQTLVDTEESLLTNSIKVEEADDDDTSASQTCTLEKGTTTDACVVNADVAEVPLDAISEGDFDHASKCDVSQSSTSSIEELQEDVVAVSKEDCDASNHPSNIIEESIVLVGVEGGLKGRSLTLEEATDAILFCSSIVHNLAQNAATIAIEKENASEPLNNDQSWPLIPATRKSDLHTPDLPTEKTTKRSSKFQKSKQRKDTETDTTKTPNTTETDTKTDQPKTRIVGVRDSNNGESKKPPLLESKCNCIIM